MQLLLCCVQTLDCWAAPVQVPHDSRSEMWCSFDGKDRQRLAPGDSVLIFMSQHPIPTVCKLDASHDW